MAEEENVINYTVKLIIHHEDVELGYCFANGLEIKEQPVGKPLLTMGSAAPIVFPSAKKHISAWAKAILVPDSKQIRFLIEMSRSSWGDFEYILNSKDCAMSFHLTGYGRPFVAGGQIIIPDCRFVGKENGKS